MPLLILLLKRTWEEKNTLHAAQEIEKWDSMVHIKDVETARL
jgi:hypothetical protein